MAVLALSLIAGVPALATTVALAPQPVAAYLAACKTNWKACKNQVLIASIELMAGRDVVSDCLVKKQPDDDDEMTKQVVAWLSSHRAYRKAETTQAIQDALKAIYCE